MSNRNLTHLLKDRSWMIGLAIMSILWWVGQSGCKKDPSIPVTGNKITLDTTRIDSVNYREAKVRTIITNPNGIEGICGHCWITEGIPTLSGQHSETQKSNKELTISDRLTNLKPGTSYRLRAYFKSQRDTVYGTTITLVTLALTKPIVITSSASETTQTMSVVGGIINNDGGTAISERGIYWGTLPDPFVTGTKRSIGSGIGIFSETFTGLTPGTTYYVKAYAINETGIGFGEELSLITEVAIPKVTTAQVTNKTGTSAELGGTVTSAGGGMVTERGVYWGISGNPVITGTKLSIGSGNGVFSENLIGLVPATNYHVIAFASNSAGTGYGDEVSFTTGMSNPTVITASVSTKTSTTALVGGMIISDGGTSVTDRGVYFGTAPDPFTTGIKLSAVIGTAAFSINLNDLTPGTTYYVGAYASNDIGTGFGDEVTFTTNASVPSVTTTPVTNKTSTSAEVGGIVTSGNGGTITERGVYWGTSSNPVSNGFKRSMGSGLGAFSENLTDLTPGITYYIKAYSINNVGIGYGEEVTFTTGVAIPIVSTSEVTSKTQSTALVGGIVNSDGGSTVTERGVYWSTLADPVTNGTLRKMGSGKGVFSEILTELTPGTTYFIRAYAVNSIGTAFGNEISFKTNPALPTIITTPATDITQTTASSGGTVQNDGGANMLARGACWSTAPNPTTDNTTTMDGNSVGSFTSSITGLIANTTYYVRAYAINTVGTNYGNEVSFRTSPALPTLTTTPITAINQTSASLGGNVTNDGGANIIVRGVCWSTSPGPTIFENKTVDGIGTGVFTSVLTGLSIGTTYSAKAYATNIAGTSYGNEINFSTPGTFTDSRDGTVYPWVRIGNQIWMAKNLAFLPAVSQPDWGSSSVKHFYVYGYEGSTISEAKANTNYSAYGVLYNWPAAMDGSASSTAGPSGVQGVCPTGWHLPSDAEWNNLTNFLGLNAGQKMKSTSGWSFNGYGDNSSGFDALPGGFRFYGGIFTEGGNKAFFWSTSLINLEYPNYRGLFFSDVYVDQGNYYASSSGFSIRCVKN